jgi:hypothetical protein
MPPASTRLLPKTTNDWSINAEYRVGNENHFQISICLAFLNRCSGGAFSRIHGSFVTKTNPHRHLKIQMYNLR